MSLDVRIKCFAQFYLLKILFRLNRFMLATAHRRRCSNDASLVACHLTLSQQLTTLCFFLLSNVVAFALIKIEQGISLQVEHHAILKWMEQKVKAEKHIIICHQKGVKNRCKIHLATQEIFLVIFVYLSRQKPGVSEKRIPLYKFACDSNWNKREKVQKFVFSDGQNRFKKVSRHQHALSDGSLSWLIGRTLSISIAGFIYDLYTLHNLWHFRCLEQSFATLLRNTVRPCGWQLMDCETTYSGCDVGGRCEVTASHYAPIVHEILTCQIFSVGEKNKRNSSLMKN